MDNAPAKPIQMYVVEKLHENGEIEVVSIGLDEFQANELAEMGNMSPYRGDDKSQLVVRNALLHYERPAEQQHRKSYISRHLLDTDMRRI